MITLSQVTIPGWIMVLVSVIGLIGIGLVIGSFMERAFGKTGFAALRSEIIDLVKGIHNDKPDNTAS